MNQAQMIALVNQLTAQLMSSGGGYGGDLHNIAGQMDNLLKSISEVGYQTPLTPSSGNFSPLVPQWLDPEIKIATVEMQDEIVLYNDLERKDVKNTIAEYNRLTSRGQGMHPFFAEGSAPGNTSTTWDKQYISVRYVGRRGEVSDVANTVALNGYANADALQVEKQERTNDLLLAVEAASFHGLNAINPLAFDGIIKQITAGGGLVTDKAGSSTSVSDIFDHIIELANNPNYKGGKPTVIYADLNAFGQFIKAAQETPNNLFFRDAIKSAEGLDYGVRSIRITNPRGMGAVTLKAAPRLLWAITPPTAAEGTVGTAVSVAVQPVNDAGLSGTSQWAAGDAGAYRYILVPVYKKGQGAPITTNAVTVAATNKIKIEMTDAAAQSGDNPLYYYEVFRTSKDGAAPTTCKRIQQVAVNTSGAAGGTQITDLNIYKYDASKLVICDPRPAKMAMFQLLPVMLRPLAQVETTIPFLVQAFMSPVCFVPEQCSVIHNTVIT